MEHPKARLLQGAHRVWVEAPEDYGTAHLAEAFLELAPEGHQRIWIELRSEALEDPVAVGNAFSDAMYTALGLLLPSGMEWGVLTALWAKQAHLFQPMSVAITGADQAPEFVTRLMELSSEEDRWFLAGENLAEFDSHQSGIILQVDDLRLSEEDFSPSFAEKAGQEALARAIRETQGAFERLLVQLHQEGAVPEPLRPGSRGPRLLTPQP
ncbi:MAG TPA: hypothetical protein ENK37_06070, partial [Oceanithermus profundus]|nr:hypothetical protein [Oceanithermus profundus]